MTLKSQKLNKNFFYLFLIVFLLFVFINKSKAQSPVYLGQGCTTAFHIDKDCDNYGVGTYVNDIIPLLGPDADDNDLDIHSAQQAISKWGTLTAFFQHLGYNSLRYWILDSINGNDNSCLANSDPDLATPCQTFTHVKSLLAANDMILFKTGTYPAIGIKGGSTNAPIIYKAYPGELPIIDSAADRVSATNQSWFVIDGLKLENSASNPAGIGITGGTYYGDQAHCLNGTGNPDSCYAGSNCVSCPSLYHDITFRNLEISHSYWGINNTNGELNYTLEDSVIHNDCGGEHNVYLGSREVPSENVVVRRNLFFNSGASGNAWKFNGRCSNCLLEANIAHTSYGVGFDFENGWNNSIVRNNLSFNHLNGAVKIFNYDPNTATHICGEPNYICPYDQNNNVFENNTFWLGTKGPDGSNISQSLFLIFHSNSTQNTNVGFLGNNIFRNNIFMTSMDSHYPLINYDPGKLDLANSELASDTWENNIFYSSVAGSTSVVGNGELGSGYGYKGYDCTQFSTFSNVNNCYGINPLFVSQNTTFFNSPGNFDFQLQDSSPAIGASINTDLPAKDLRNITRLNPSAIGAYEFNSNILPSYSIVDFINLLSGWLDQGNQSDISKDGRVNAKDLGIMMSKWN